MFYILEELYPSSLVCYLPHLSYTAILVTADGDNTNKAPYHDKRLECVSPQDGPESALHQQTSA